MLDESVPYKNLCTQYYELDKPTAPEDALKLYLDYAEEAGGAISESIFFSQVRTFHFSTRHISA